MKLSIVFLGISVILAVVGCFTQKLGMNGANVGAFIFMFLGVGCLMMEEKQEENC